MTVKTENGQILWHTTRTTICRLPEIFDPQEMFVTLDLDDGSQLECQILTIFDVDNQNYIALVPVDNDDEVIFYRYFEDEEGNPSLENIDHDDEFDAVSDRFDELLDEEEFDQM